MLEIGEKKVGTQAREIFFAVGSGGKKDDRKTRRTGGTKVVRRISDEQRFSGGSPQNAESFEKHVGGRFFPKSVSLPKDTGQRLPETEMIRNASSRIALFVRDDPRWNPVLGKSFQNVLRSRQWMRLLEDNPVVMGAEKEDPFFRLFFRNDAAERVSEGRANDRQHFLPGQCPVDGKSIQNGLERAVDGPERVDKGAVKIEKDPFREKVLRKGHFVAEPGEEKKRVVSKFSYFLAPDDGVGGPNGFRTRVSGVRGQRPGPLDDGTIQMTTSEA